MTSQAATASARPTIPAIPARLRLVLGGAIFLALAYVLLGPQQFVNALTLGSIYALIALGYTMVYGIIELINFAHGDVFMVGAFVTMVFITNGLGFGQGFGVVGYVAVALIGVGIGLAVTRGIGEKRPPIVLAAVAMGLLIAFALEFGLHLTSPMTDPLQLAVVLLPVFLIAMVSMGALNLSIERFAYRRLRNAPRLAPLITAIGVSFILQNIVQIWQGNGDRGVTQIFPLAWKIPLAGASVGLLNIFIFLMAIGLMLALQAFVGRTRLGRAMRSTAQDKEAAALMGVDLNQTIAVTFLLGGALAGAAGVFQGLYFGFVRFDLGFNAGLKAFTAAVLGGIGNLGGAVVGGFVIGFVEVAATSFGYTRWSHAIVFAVLIIVLVFRPSGILGQRLGEQA
jgi:branched-chain amino acid transport system permease protein